MQRVPADRRPFMRGDDLVVQVVADVEHIAPYSCQPVARGLCSKSRAAGAPRASRGLTGPHEVARRRDMWLSQIDMLSRAGFEKSELARDIEPARASAPAREGAKRRGCYLDA